MAFQAGAVTAKFTADITDFSRKMGAVTKSLEGIKDQAKKVGGSIKNSLGNIAVKGVSILKNSLIGLGAGLVAVGGFGLKASADIEQLKTALLTTFQGSEKASEQAFKQITEFTKTTPFQLDGVLRGFIKLKNMGLDPSERALRSYGDTASAMGKSLNDMVEAVADASTMEFERLKEFGIRATQQKDTVTFFFRGTKQVVKRDSKAIEEYLIKLGETSFAGGMERQSKTINGLLSTLKDNLFLTFANISERSGLSDFVRNGLERLNNWFATNEDTINSFIDNAVTRLQTFFQLYVVPTFNFLTNTVLPNLINFWNNVMIPAFQYFADKILPKMVKLWQDHLLPAIENIWSAIKDNLWPAIKDLWQSLSNLWTLISPVVIPVLKFLGATLAVLVYSAILFVINAITFMINVYTWLADTTTWVIQKIVDGWNWLKSIFESVMNFINADAETKAYMIGYFFGNVVQWIIDRFNDAKEWVITKFNEIVGFAQGLPGRFAEIFQQIKDFISGKINDSTDDVKNKFDSLKNINLYEIGKQIIQGLIDGIKGQAQALKNQVSGMADSIKNGFKDALQIKSPSRWMRDNIGNNISLGISDGIDKEAPKALSSVNDLVAGMKDGTTNQINKTTNNNRTINVYNYNQGQGRSKFYENYELAV